MTRELKKTVSGNESKWKFHEDFDLLVESLAKKKNEVESEELEQLIDFYQERTSLCGITISKTTEIAARGTFE